MSYEQEKTTQRKGVLTEEQLQQIKDQAASIRYGTISLVFQDGHLVQIDRCEKIRV